MSHGDEPLRSVLRRMGELSVPSDLADNSSRQYRVAATVDAHLEQLSRKHARARSWRRLAAALSVAAMAALGLTAARRLSSPATSAPASAEVVLKTLQGNVAVAREGQLTDAGQGSVPLAAADEVRTGQSSRAQALLKNGAVAIVEESSVLVLGSWQNKEEELTLRRGKVQLSVPHLALGGAFAVRTPDALVTVHGTEFSVAVDEEGGHTVTNVAVTRGAVWVEHASHTVVLTAGGSWSSDTQPLSVETATSAPPPPAATPAPNPPRAPSNAGEITERSTLAEENRAYLSAMTAARVGDDRRAVRELEALLEQHPGSPLAQSAEADRFRALSRMGRVSDAARAARHYLANYPQGFAASEARALLGSEH